MLLAKVDGPVKLPGARHAKVQKPYIACYLEQTVVRACRSCREARQVYASCRDRRIAGRVAQAQPDAHAK
jgi:hypothetical protein